MKPIEVMNINDKSVTTVFFSDLFEVFVNDENINNSYIQIFISYLPFIEKIAFTYNCDTQYIEFSVNGNNILLYEKKLVDLIYTVCNVDIPLF